MDVASITSMVDDVRSVEEIFFLTAAGLMVIVVASVAWNVF